jgi:hypothetical protein
VERPKMNGELHLLTLMHQQLEEARALGHGEPRLEYRHEAPHLTVRVAGVDAVEKIGYGNMRQALRRLASEGYVELDHNADSSAGTVNLTGKGLEKVRYLRAFRSNLPRSLKRWEISLLGPREIKHMRLWKASWEGREITVRNRRVFLGKHHEPMTEYLNVDNRFPPAYRMESAGSSKDLYGELRAVDGVHELHAHIGQTAPLRRTGCLIAVDGVVIGGDVGKRFLT